MSIMVIAGLPLIASGRRPDESLLRSRAISLDISREDFTEADHARFAERLQQSLDALARLLTREGFGTGPATLGAELELTLVDPAGRPLPVNRAVLAAAVDPRVTLEIDRFNLEVNTRPVPLAGRAFTALAGELADALGAIDRAAAAHGGRSVIIGILPTLTGDDLRPGALTDSRRYRALSAGIRRLRHEPFSIRIDGDDPLEVACDDVTLEGANTSLQIHLRVPPREFAACTTPRSSRPRRCSPLGQLAAVPRPPALGGDADRALPAGRGRALAAAEEDWRPAACRSVTAGCARARSSCSPRAWRCTRRCCRWSDGGPGGCVARRCTRARGAAAAPRHGLALEPRGLRPERRRPRPHRDARAPRRPDGGGHGGQRGLPGRADARARADARRLVTAAHVRPGASQLLRGRAARTRRRAALALAQRLRPRDPCEPPTLVRELLPVARGALLASGVDAAEVDALLEVIAVRVATGRTGARWQRHMLADLERSAARETALRELVGRYLGHAASGRPVHEWPVDA